MKVPKAWVEAGAGEGLVAGVAVAEVEDVAVADTTKNLRTNYCGIAICLKEGWTKHLSDAAPVL